MTNVSDMTGVCDMTGVNDMTDVTKMTSVTVTPRHVASNLPWGANAGIWGRSSQLPEINRGLGTTPQPLEAGFWGRSAQRFLRFFNKNITFLGILYSFTRHYFQKYCIV